MNHPQPVMTPVEWIEEARTVFILMDPGYCPCCVMPDVHEGEEPGHDPECPVSVLLAADYWPPPKQEPR